MYRVCYHTNLQFGLLTGLYSCLTGLLIFLIAALDDPYRGEIGAGPDAFELVLDRMQKM